MEEHKVNAMISHFTIIGTIVALMMNAEKKNEFVSFYTRQTLGLFLCFHLGAYFVGKSIGKTKFCETSPNKTIEGVIGGVIFAVLLGTLFSTNGISFVNALIISAIVSIVSIFGDLFESYLKREAGVKDSGTILPGHGGVLDRTDGYLFGAIVMLVLLRVVI